MSGKIAKPVPLSGQGWDFIRAYGKVLGITEEEMAAFLLTGAVTDLMDSGALGRSHESMKLARKILRRKA